MKYLTASELAAIVGVSVHTVRYYQKINLIQSLKIENNGYHYYDLNTVQKMMIINILKNSGMSLAMIKKIVTDYDNELIKTSLIASKNELLQEINKLQQQCAYIDELLIRSEKMNETNFGLSQFNLSIKQVYGTLSIGNITEFKEEQALIKKNEIDPQLIINELYGYLCGDENMVSVATFEPAENRMCYQQQYKVQISKLNFRENLSQFKKNLSEHNVNLKKGNIICMVQPGELLNCMTIDEVVIKYIYIEDN